MNKLEIERNISKSIIQKLMGRKYFKMKIVNLPPKLKVYKLKPVSFILLCYRSMKGRN